MSKLFRVRPRAEGVVGGPWPSNPLLRGLNEGSPGVAQPSLQCVHPASQGTMWPRWKQHVVKTGIWDCARMQRGVEQRGEIGGEIVRSCAKHSQVTLWWRLFGGLQSLNCTCKLDATKRWDRDCWADFWETVWSEECQTTFKREERHKY